MIFGRHSVLKRGCSTWHQELAPREEFQLRLDLTRREMARLNLDAMVVYGDNYSFADLCYLTNYFPKVRGGIALVCRAGIRRKSLAVRARKESAMMGRTRTANPPPRDIGSKTKSGSSCATRHQRATGGSR